MKIVTVIPLKKGFALSDLTYFTSKDVPLGSIVTVPLRNKNILGLVTSIEEVTDAKRNIKDMDFNLKKIIDIKKYSIFSEDYLESILKASKYFISSKNTAVSSLIPALFREKYDEIAKLTSQVRMKEKKHTNAKGVQKKIKSEKFLLQASPETRISTYKTLIRGSFADKKSVFIIFPNERDIEKFYFELSKGIEQFTCLIHSGLTPKETLKINENIVTNEHALLVLTTTPFLSIPRSDIGTIILEHESSTAYKMLTRPYFDLRVFVELFAAKINAKFILGDTLLRFETFARREIDGLIPLHPLSFRIDYSGEMYVSEGSDNHREKQNKDTKFKVISDENILEIKKALKNKQNVFIFSLRKGLATMTVCRDCADTVNCERCMAPVVLYLSKDGKKRIFSCNRCKEEIDPEIKCKNCSSWNLMPLGIGTDTVCEYIKDVLEKDGTLSKTKIYKLDKESAKNAKGAKKIIYEFEEDEASILVGTEMAFTYLNEKVPLSIIASFDSLWSIPNYKMSEKIVQIIYSVLLNTKNKFIIQTKNPKDRAILAVKNSNLLSFVREELEDRKILGYPPYKRFIKISYQGSKDKAQSAGKFLSENLTEYSPEIFSGFVSKEQEKYSVNALLRVNTARWALREISADSDFDEILSNKLTSLSPSFQVTVDPEDLH